MLKKSVKIFIVIGMFFATFSLAQAATLGGHTFFFVDIDYDILGRSALRAMLLNESEHAYFYVEDDWWNELDSKTSMQQAVAELALEFDTKIYPTLTKNFGSPWEPGIDNDKKITILIFRIQEGAGGYFNSADEYLRDQVAQSNEREMIYLNSSYLTHPRIKSFLAHEFQHLITFYQKEKLRGVVEEVWLNEARSEYAPTMLGYDGDIVGSNLDKRIADFFKNPSDSLTEWENVANDYGSANLFMQYLVGHYGGQFLPKLVQRKEVGVESINATLSELGFSQTFSDVFLGWTISNYLNDCRIEGQKYCYLQNDLSQRIKVSPTVFQVLSEEGIRSVNWTDTVKDWSGHWYKFSAAAGNLRIEFSAPGSDKFKVAQISQFVNGTNEVKLIGLDSSGKGTGLVQNLGTDVKEVVLVPISETSNLGFGSSEPFRRFSYDVSLTTQATILPPAPVEASNPTPSPSYPDGSLIRAKGDYKVYIIKNGYKRWIQSAEIFNFYGHLGFAQVIEVTNEELDWYNDAWLVRADGDQKVYEINGDGTKHWLNMTAEQFSQSGRKWDMVYVINSAERNWYETGAEVLFK